MEVRPEDFIYTAEQITEMCDTWANFNGFTGETCDNCNATANVFALEAGWFCVCGHYNVQLWSHSQIVHENPRYGATRVAINEGMVNSEKLKNILGE